MELDAAIVSAYVEIDTPADRLVLHREFGDRFVELVGRKTERPIMREQALERLITLRKLGRLPRLRRNRRSA